MQRHHPRDQLEFPAVRWEGPAGIIDTETRWEQARRLLWDNELNPDDRVAGLLVLLYAQKPAVVSRLTLPHVEVNAVQTRFRLGDEPVVLPEPLAALVHQLVATRRGHAVLGDQGTSTWLFPGGQPGRPISADRLRERLKLIGLRPGQARSAALFQLATETSRRDPGADAGHPHLRRCRLATRIRRRLDQLRRRRCPSSRQRQHSVMRQPVTASLLHRLVAGSHAEGTTRLAVAAVIEDHQRILLANIDNSWDVPTHLVLPGESLDDAVHRTVATTGIHIHQITGYLGHHDRHPSNNNLLRTFVFSATSRASDDLPTPHRYRWAPIDDLHADHNSHILTFVLAADYPDNHTSQLPADLRAHARGVLPTEAAIELLISHRSWLHHPDFNAYITTGHDSTNTTLMAWVDWPAAIAALDTAALPCSNSEARILRIAASLAEGIPLDLRDALTALDSNNTHLVIQAVLHTTRR